MSFDMLMVYRIDNVHFQEEDPMEKAAIGLSLEDLGLESVPGSEPSGDYVPGEYPKEFDFTTALAVLGSWEVVRDVLGWTAREAYNGDLPLHFSLYWTEMEGETEETIKSALTGVRYDKVVYDSFEGHYVKWAASSDLDVECLRHIATAVADAPAETRRRVQRELAANPNTPADILLGLAKDNKLTRRLLANEELSAEVVRAVARTLFRMNHPAEATQSLAKSRATLPPDVIEMLARQNYITNDIPKLLDSRADATVKARLDLAKKVLLPSYSQVRSRCLHGDTPAPAPEPRRRSIWQVVTATFGKRGEF